MTSADLWTATDGLEVSVLEGLSAVTAKSALLGNLSASCGVPATCRWPWQSASVPPGGHPLVWAVTVEDGAGLAAAAVLLDEVEDGVLTSTLLGTADGHRGALLSTTPATAQALGRGLATRLLSHSPGFRLGPLAADEALSSLLRHLPTDVDIEPVAVPSLVPGEDPEGELGKAMRRNLRKARNRLAADGVRCDLDVLDDGGAIAAVLPLILTIARDRDLACNRTSPHDDPARRGLWQSRLLALAAEGSLRLATLRLDGEVAAYVLAIVDGGHLRVLDGRYVDRFSRYAPGRLLEAELVERVRASPAIYVVDWMTTIGPESLLAANHSDELVTISGRL